MKVAKFAVFFIIMIMTVHSVDGMGRKLPNKPELQHVPDIVSVTAVTNIKLPVH